MIRNRAIGNFRSLGIGGGRGGMVSACKSREPREFKHFQHVSKWNRLLLLADLPSFMRRQILSSEEKISMQYHHYVLVSRFGGSICDVSISSSYAFCCEYFRLSSSASRHCNK